MPTLKFTPLSQADLNHLATLLDEEDRCWLSELGWDYSEVRRILSSFIEHKLLPGYVALDGNRIVGYAYFLTHGSKGIIAAVFVAGIDGPQAVAEEILSLVIDCLKRTPRILRIESQIMPFNGLNLTGGFERQGFRCYTRYYLELDLRDSSLQENRPAADQIVRWDAAFLSRAAEVTFNTYTNQPDAQLCEDYRTFEGCRNYLHSLIDNPGCGAYLSEASFMGLDKDGAPCGFVIGSRISDTAGMIPQIAILPTHQGKGLGNTLMFRSLSYFKAHGYHTVSLAVTKKNKRAFEWYKRLGFRIRKEFEAYVWER